LSQDYAPPGASPGFSRGRVNGLLIVAGHAAAEFIVEGVIHACVDPAPDAPAAGPVPGATGRRPVRAARRDADGFPAGGESLPLHLGAPRRRPGATALADRAGLLPVPEAPALRRTRPGLAAAVAARRKPQRRVLRRVAGLSPEPGTDPA